MTQKMKKTIFFAMMAAVLGFTACSKEDPAQNETAARGMMLHPNAYMMLNNRRNCILKYLDTILVFDIFAKIRSHDSNKH